MTLHERLRTHKVLTKDQCFYLNYHKFSIKSYVWMCIRIASVRRFLYTSTAYEDYGEISKFFTFSQFYYMLGGNLGSLLYGDVSVMEALLL